MKFWDNTGLLLKTIKISNGLTPQQSDYEDLAKDDNQNLYIADVGDNQLNKGIYRIYKINTDSTELTEVPTITFFYPDFENINCESIFWWEKPIESARLNYQVLPGARPTWRI